MVMRFVVKQDYNMQMIYLKRIALSMKFSDRGDGNILINNQSFFVNF